METHHKTNICWDCEKACGGCSWSRNFEPVPGWKAKKIRWSRTKETTYMITKCPLFERTPDRYIREEHVDYSPAKSPCLSCNVKNKKDCHLERCIPIRRWIAATQEKLRRNLGVRKNE